MTTPRDAIGLKELGQRTDAELETMFGDMYAGWDRGVNVTQERFGNGATRFTETPMTPLELAARYVAAEIGANIYEIANRAAFAPITVFSQIQARIGPVFDEAATQLDALQARVKELEQDASDTELLKNTYRNDCAVAVNRALRAEQKRYEAYERAASAVAKWKLNSHILLHAGEMGAQELRSVKVIVNAIEGEIRRLAAGD